MKFNLKSNLTCNIYVINKKSVSVYVAVCFSLFQIIVYLKTKLHVSEK